MDKRSPGRVRRRCPGKHAAPPTWLIFLVILGVNYLLMSALYPSPTAPLTVPYTVFKTQVENGNVVAIYSQGESIEGGSANP